MDFLSWKTGDEGKKRLLLHVKKIAESFCVQGSVGVAPSYANRYARNSADMILIGYEEKTPVAFILAKHEPTSLYLGVICGKPGTGRQMMDKFLEMADAEKVNVSLSAMPNVLSYYGRPEFGFTFRKSCENDSETVDASPIAGKKAPLNLLEIANDPVFGPFLVELQLRKT